MERSSAQRALALYNSATEGGSTRWASLRSNTLALWQLYKPDTLLGWTALSGASLLAASALCTALCILAAMLLSLAWVGVAVFTVLVILSTFGAAMMGTGVILFSGTCAVIGTCILSGTCTVYVCLSVINKLQATGQTYLTTMQQRLAPHTAEATATTIINPTLHGTGHIKAAGVSPTSPSAPADTLDSAPDPTRTPGRGQEPKPVEAPSSVGPRYAAIRPEVVNGTVSAVTSINSAQLEATASGDTKPCAESAVAVISSGVERDESVRPAAGIA